MQFIFSIPNAREKIEQKIKTFTMRKPWKNGKGIPEIGETLYLKDGRRWIKAGTPGSLQPIYIDGKNPTCTGVWPVEIEIGLYHTTVTSDFFVQALRYYKNRVQVSRGMNGLQDKEQRILKAFATMDGWNNAQEMIDFFKLPFVGNLIYWGKR